MKAEGSMLDIGLLGESINLARFWNLAPDLRITFVGSTCTCTYVNMHPGMSSVQHVIGSWLLLHTARYQPW